MNLLLQYYLCEICDFIHWSHWHVKSVPTRVQNIIAHHTAHYKLDNVERNEEGVHVFSKCLDVREVPSLCQISGVRISGRQFFPCKGIRQVKKLFYVRYTITVMRTKLQWMNEWMNEWKNSRHWLCQSLSSNIYISIF
jgi:hypothetical protein